MWVLAKIKIISEVKSKINRDDNVAYYEQGSPYTLFTSIASTVKNKWSFQPIIIGSFLLLNQMICSIKT